MDGLMSHRQRLREQHEELDRRINEEQQRPNPDTQILHDLKRQKLTIKDTLDSSG
jgi:hypothetical protein